MVKWWPSLFALISSCFTSSAFVTSNVLRECSPRGLFCRRQLPNLFRLSPSTYLPLQNHGHVHDGFDGEQTEFEPNTATAMAAASFGSSSLSSSTFNLAKTIIGAGILSLPSGVSSFSSTPQALGISTAILLFMGLVSAYGFSSIGKACGLSRATTFGEAWERSTGSQSTSVLSGIIVIKTLFACLAYSIILGDSFSKIFQAFGLPSILCARSNVILILTSLFIVPLCLLKKLEALKYTSLLGLTGTLYCSAFMTWRLLDGSYRPGGEFYSAISDQFKPKFSSGLVELTPQMFHLVSMASSAYVAHFNAPKIWSELKNPTLSRFNTVVVGAYSFAALMYWVVMATGFLTFGGHSSGMILNNYANSDKLAAIARITVGLGLLCSYPLAFSALRESAFDLLKLKTPIQRDNAHVPVTLGVISVITLMALVLRDVGVVVGLGGALIGAMLMYTIPSYMNLCIMSSDAGKAVDRRWAKTAERLVNIGLMGMGAAIAVIGVVLTLQKMSK